MRWGMTEKWQRAYELEKGLRRKQEGVGGGF